MNRLGKVGLVIISVFFFVAVFAPLLAPFDPREQTQLESGLPTEERLKPTSEHLFGRDDLGRDVLSRVIYGARISMRVGASVVLISAIIGTIIGAISGYYGGWVDRFLSGFLFNVFLPFPSILLAIAMVAFLGPSLHNLILALSVIGGVGSARVMRRPAPKVRQLDFATDARARSWRKRSANHRSPYAAERHPADDRAGESGDGWRGPGGSQPELPGPRRAASRAELGGDAQRRAQLSSRRPAFAHLSRHCG